MAYESRERELQLGAVKHWCCVVLPAVLLLVSVCFLLPEIAIYKRFKSAECKVLSMGEDYRQYFKVFFVRQVEVSAPVLGENGKVIGYRRFRSHACMGMACVMPTSCNQESVRDFYATYKNGNNYECMYDPVYLESLGMKTRPLDMSSDEYFQVSANSYLYVLDAEDNKSNTLNYEYQSFQPNEIRRPSGYDSGYRWSIFSPIEYHTTGWVFTGALLVFNIFNIMYHLHKAMKWFSQERKDMLTLAIIAITCYPCTEFHNFKNYIYNSMYGSTIYGKYANVSRNHSRDEPEYIHCPFESLDAPPKY